MSHEKLKAKGGRCTAGKDMPCRNDDSIKRKDWCYSCKTYSTLYIFFDFETNQNTGKHEINLSVAQDYDGKEYIHENIDDFCKYFINEKFKGHNFLTHNGKGFDFVFVLKFMVEHGINPFCIYNGSKIMFMEIPKLSIRFMNCLNFLLMALKEFPDTFGMEELKKRLLPSQL